MKKTPSRTFGFQAWMNKWLTRLASWMTKFLPIEVIQKQMMKNWQTGWAQWKPSELFPETQEIYDRFIDTHFFSTLKPTSDLLDLGCAEGADSLRAASLCHHVYGIDISPKLLKIAQERESRFWNEI